jgi:GNAT superfamily N-acetyltransferase
MDDEALARRSIRGFGETIAALGRCSLGAEAEVRRPNALGARIDSVGDNPWFNAAVVPLGESPPRDDPGLPYCIWTAAGAVPGRVAEPEIETPCMGRELDDPPLERDGGREEIGGPSPEVVGALNERAYGEPEGTFGPLIAGLHDDRFSTHGLRRDGSFVCVALTLRIGDDLSIQYLATEASHRRRGLAGLLLREVMAGARADGLASATLQASPDGLSVYLGLGFRPVATLRGYVRPT